MALAAVAAVGLGACGTRQRDGGTTTAASTPATTATTVPATSTTAPATTAAATTTTTAAAAIAEITKNWETFFRAGTTIPERQALLENGSQYLQALTIRAADPLQAQASAKVRSVTLTDAQHAHVVYDVLLGTTVGLASAEGNAVLQDGIWKVSAESFCSLISLGATQPIPGCS